MWHGRRIQLSEINLALNHVTENALTRARNGHRTTHFSGFISHNKFRQCKYKMPTCSALHILPSQRQKPWVTNKTMYRNLMSNPFNLFPSHLRKGILNIQEGPIWHDKNRLNAMYTWFKMLSQIRELNCKAEILMVTVSWHCLVVRVWTLTANLVVLGFFFKCIFSLTQCTLWSIPILGSLLHSALTIY